MKNCSFNTLTATVGKLYLFVLFFQGCAYIYCLYWLTDGLYSHLIA